MRTSDAVDAIKAQARSRLRKMIEQARASHRAAMTARTDYEREALRSDAKWWLASARQEKDLQA